MGRFWGAKEGAMHWVESHADLVYWANKVDLLAMLRVR